MRRHTVAAAIAAAVLLHGPAFARAATRASARTRATTPTTVRAPGIPEPISLSVGGAPAGTLATAALRPGSSTSLHLTATNGTTSDRLEVSLSAIDANLRSDGTVAPQAATSSGPAPPGIGASSWLGLGDTGIVLTPGASVDVPLSVSVPPEATGGSVAAAVRATIAHASPVGVATTHEDVALSGVSTTLGVRIDVQAPKRAELNVTSVSVVRDHGARKVKITIANAGTTSAPVEGTLTIGTPAVRVPIHVTVPARSQSTVKVAWPKSVSTAHTAPAGVTIRHRDDNAEWSGMLDPGGAAQLIRAKVKPSTTASAPSSSGGGLGVPWFLLLAIALAIVWLGYEVVAASRERRASGPLHTGVGGGAPFIESGAVSRLHEELEPLVSAISALAQSMQPRGPVAGAPAAVAPAPPPPEPLAESFDTADWIEPALLDDGGSDLGPLEDAAETEADVDASGNVDATAGVTDVTDTTGAHTAPSAEDEPRPWEPQEVVTRILEVLARIDPRPSWIMIDDPEVVEVLEPDALVDAVASALTVAPATVRHWLSDETLEAATRASETAPRDTAHLVRERQVLAAQVEVLKRALSDLG